LYAYSFTNVSDANRNGVQYACNAYLSFDNADESEREREREREREVGGRRRRRRDVHGIQQDADRNDLPRCEKP